MSSRQTLIIIVPSLKAGGLERVASLLANILYERNVNVTLISLSNIRPHYDLKKDVKVIMPNEKISKLPKPLRIIRMFFWIRNKVKIQNKKTVLCFGEGYNAFFIASLLGLNKKIFVSNRASPLSSLNGIRRKINPFFYKYADKVLVQTEYAVQLLKPIYKKSAFEIIPNPFNIPLENEINQGQRENIILNVGRIGGNKNQELLIKYFFKIKSKKNWKLYLVGDGPNIENCKKLVNEYKLEHLVSFKGIHSDVTKFYKNAKIFAFTSTSEGFPNALGEAMTYGLAPISFDCITGPSELIDNGHNGFLIDELDENDYIEKLTLLMENDILRSKFGNEARKRMKNFSTDIIVSKYMNILFPK